jgi:hypothetical protein
MVKQMHVYISEKLNTLYVCVHSIYLNVLVRLSGDFENRLASVEFVCSTRMRQSVSYPFDVVVQHRTVKDYHYSSTISYLNHFSNGTHRFRTTNNYSSFKFEFFNWNRKGYLLTFDFFLIVFKNLWSSITIKNTTEFIFCWKLYCLQKCANYSIFLRCTHGYAWPFIIWIISIKFLTNENFILINQKKFLN